MTNCKKCIHDPHTPVYQRCQANRPRTVNGMESTDSRCSDFENRVVSVEN